MPNFQSIVPIQLAADAITTADVAVYTTPALTRTMLKDINIANTTATAAKVNLHIVPASGAVGTGNALLYEVSIAANEVYRWTGIQIMNPNEKLSVKASVAGLTLFVSGAEAVQMIKLTQINPKRH